MDFLDSLDLQLYAHDKKTARVRSWYLFEQYKALEEHQLDAAQQLRTRAVQEQLLQQELTERRARRSLFDQVSVYISDPKQGSQATCLSTNNDDFYESFCELRDFEDAQSLGSHNGSDNTFMEDKNLEDFEEDTSRADSVSSVVDREATVRSPQRTITENIKLHLQTVKENMASLERYARTGEGDRMSETSVDSLGWPKRSYRRKNVDNNQLFYMWTRLVAFAYHIIQLNHGNCYYDYSSQLLTAVLACDALRRGVNRMLYGTALWVAYAAADVL
ncbi:uncharacterized protein LOC125233402 isoform X3 [Leguminivora glycinivorella]|uniref:uncharacterized protein LOC125233402 isoform X3 n=1 Tax=Leguminivora glycinivorella TaxID=1035111 RepID=UPI00200D48AC|nr:uncharacterized protein LOC125233402 isoform X3 [Leguminivora glycinivorella]XP_047995372.1 uncharacterized protein LOC125233402 isoform X3 [Leguminivora glycinivorella]